MLTHRTADTDNNTFVKNYLATTMRNLGWHVEEDTFTDKTPYGNKRFTNVIATKDPSARRRVIVAAHFDSKFFPTFPQNQVGSHITKSCLIASHVVVCRGYRLRGTLCHDARLGGSSESSAGSPKRQTKSRA